MPDDNEHLFRALGRLNGIVEFKDPWWLSSEEEQQVRQRCGGGWEATKQISAINGQRFQQYLQVLSPEERTLTLNGRAGLSREEREARRAR